MSKPHECTERKNLDRIEKKIDKIIDDQSDIKVDIAEIRKDIKINTLDLTENKEDIAYHISRTDLLEQRIDKLEEWDIVKKHISKWVIFVGTLVAMAYGVVRLVEYII